MITGVRIKNLRGIRAGGLSDLGGLTILLGPNGSGKSAILDALMIAASMNPGEAVGGSVRRRVSASTGGRWLLWNSGREGAAEIELTTSEDRSLISIQETPGETPMLISGDEGDYALRIIARAAGAAASPQSWWRVVFTYNVGSALARIDYQVTTEERGLARPARPVRMIDPAPGGNQSDLARLFSGLKEMAGRSTVEALLKEVVPDFVRLDSLIDDKDRPIVGIEYGGEAPRAVPIGLAGDGVYVLARVAIELAACPSGLALIEEPEVHQYPKSLWRIAQAITATVARGVQVVITTHSAELVRMLLEQASERALLDQTAVVNVLLRAGQLVSSRLGGHDAFLAVDSLGEDLR